MGERARTEAEVASSGASVAAAGPGLSAAGPSADALRAIRVRRMWMAAGIVVLNALDVLLTRQVLARGGVEANPLMEGLMQGLAAPLGLKAVVAGLAGILLLRCPPRAPVGEAAAVVVLVLYGVIVLWNTAVLGVLISQ